MNLGELKVNPKFFNSQVQLNNDWFDSREKSDGFKEILANKTEKHSGITREQKPIKAKFHEDIKKTFEKVDSKRPIESSKDDVKPLNEVKAKIKEVMAKKKLNEASETVSDEDVSLEEKIEQLEAAIMEELGIKEEPELLEMVAELLGMSVEQLEQSLTGSDESKEEIVNKLVALVENEDVEPKQLVKALKQLFVKMEQPEKNEFEKVLEQVVKELPEGQAKEVLTDFEKVVEKVTEQVKVAEHLPVTELKEAETIKQTDVKPVVQEPQVSQSEKPVEVVEAKADQAKQEQSTDKPADPIMNAEIKTKKVATKVTVEDQVNIMRTGSTTVVTGKESPKAILSRSVMNQVVQGTKMSINLSENGQEILVKLNPKNLGNVALKMAFDKGQLMAQIQVENQTVKGIIESNLDDLKNALREEGYEIGDLDVSVNKENSGEQSSQQFSQGNSRKFVKHETFEEVEEKIKNQHMKDDGFDYLA